MESLKMWLNAPISEKIPLKKGVAVIGVALIGIIVFAVSKFKGSSTGVKKVYKS